MSLHILCKYCNAIEQSKLSALTHICDKDVLRERITGQHSMLTRIYDEASAITASGFPANSDVDTTGWRIDLPLYLELEEFLYPGDETTEGVR